MYYGVVHGRKDILCLFLDTIADPPFPPKCIAQYMNGPIYSFGSSLTLSGYSRMLEMHWTFGNSSHGIKIPPQVLANLICLQLCYKIFCFYLPLQNTKVYIFTASCFNNKKLMKYWECRK